ncbi:DUF262 domain-containing protein (plasmid) [Paenibacillus thiaminolyticus]|uniref:DUF262 domain-containing protein n=1 Tax=Paenibacillus thiaminolyticus TaxID=49283 RepID=UPI00232AAB84|nr:DUF262 domain-containing protein [Paenibacillus thiaminolyticus]WCF11479.1 DUF262 domain-containing protein [Paenibacillus thiaminolyticus]
MKFRDIKPFHTYGNYRIDVPLLHVPSQIEQWKEEMGLIMEPDFQRSYVWTERQQIAYVEFLLREGRSGRDILFNHTKWETFQSADDGYFVCVDGLQRTTAIIRFIHNEIKAFGYSLSDYEDRHLMNRITLKFHVNSLPDRKSVLEWYLQLNAGGTVHTESDLERVRLLLRNEC